MSFPAVSKRFWSETTVVEADGGWRVRLDGRAIKTPAKSPFVLPTRALADAVASEWEAQKEKIEPATMPFTRTANSAIDKVAVQHKDVADMLAEYGDADLICYRAEGPETLVARQAAAWDPLLNWAAESLAAPLSATAGILHVSQPESSRAKLHQRVAGFDAFSLAGFHDLVTISGSLVLGLATVLEYLTPQSAWEMSRIDEDWQQEQWGVDEEATKAAAIKNQAFLDAFTFCKLSQST